jgi:hypothetical protein
MSWLQDGEQILPRNDPSGVLHRNSVSQGTLKKGLFVVAQRRAGDIDQVGIG